MMSQPKLCNTHPWKTTVAAPTEFQVQLRPVQSQRSRDVAVVSVLGVADLDVAPLGAED
jgi:hypothetical protein